MKTQLNLEVLKYFHSIHSKKQGIFLKKTVKIIIKFEEQCLPLPTSQKRKKTLY